MITDFESTEDIQLTGKSMTNSLCDRGTSPSGRVLKIHEQLVDEEGTSKDSKCAPDMLNNCECLGLHVNNNPLQRIPKGQPEIWCLFGTQIVKTLLDTGVYKSLIQPTVLERIQKDAILKRDDGIHTLCCANKMTNETLGSVRLRFTISDEVYEHWFLIFREQSCPAILGLDFLKENRMCICWNDEQRLELLMQQKWLALNGVERVTMDNGEYQMGVLKAVCCMVIPAGLHTSHECGWCLRMGCLLTHTTWMLQVSFSIKG